MSKHMNRDLVNVEISNFRLLLLLFCFVLFCFVCLFVCLFFSSQMYETDLGKFSMPESKSPVLLDYLNLLWLL